MAPKPLQEIAALATQLRDSNALTLAIDEVTAIATDLINHSFPLSLGTEANHIWYRARPCDADGYPTLQEVIYRADAPTFGRASIPGRTAFYAAWNVLTALAEISAATGQYIQIVAVRAPNERLLFTAFGELTYLIHAGQLRLPVSPMTKDEFWKAYQMGDDETQRRWLYLDAFISEEFRKTRAQLVEYQITAALAEAAYLESPKAVAYPSVQAYGAQNIAIPGALFDECMEVVGTLVLRVEKFHGYGVYELTPIRISHEFEAGGRINWNSKLPPFARQPNNGQIIVPDGYVGWRVPKAPAP